MRPHKFKVIKVDNSERFDQEHAEELLKKVIKMADFTEHRQQCCSQQEDLYKEIELFLKNRLIDLT